MKAVGEFINNQGVRIIIFPRRDESKDKAIQRVTSRHGKSPKDVKPVK